MKIARIIACIVVLVIVGLCVVWMKAPTLMSKALSKKAQVEVTIADIDLSRDSLEVKDFVINNPKNSVLAQALSIHSIEIDAPLSHYMSDPIVIDKIEINKIYLGLEYMGQTALTTNWNMILNNLKGAQPAVITQNPVKNEKGRKVIIKKLILTDIRSDIVLNQTLGAVKHMDPIARLEFDNLSSDDGLTVLLLDQMLRAVFANQAMPATQKAIEKLTSPFKDLLPK